MDFDGNDYIVLGLALGMGSAVLFAKAYLIPSFPAESAQTFWDANPFVARNSITSRHEAIAGVVWLIAATATSLWGVIRTARDSREGYLISSLFDLVVLFAAILVAGRLTVAITDRTSRAEYVPVVAHMQRDLYQRTSFMVLHEGQYPEEVGKGQKPTVETLTVRSTQIVRNLEQIGKLLDNPRLKDEDNLSYIRRLAVYFPGIESN